MFQVVRVNVSGKPHLHAAGPSASRSGQLRGRSPDRRPKCSRRLLRSLEARTHAPDRPNVHFDRRRACTRRGRAVELWCRATSPRPLSPTTHQGFFVPRPAAQSQKFCVLLLRAGHGSRKRCQSKKPKPSSRTRKRRSIPRKLSRVLRPWPRPAPAKQRRQARRGAAGSTSWLVGVGEEAFSAGARGSKLGRYPPRGITIVIGSCAPSSRK